MFRLRGLHGRINNETGGWIASSSDGRGILSGISPRRMAVDEKFLSYLYSQEGGYKVFHVYFNDSMEQNYQTLVEFYINSS